MSFPEIKFGICQICGAKGQSYGAADLTGADASSRSTSGVDGYDPGNGVELEKHQGKLLCSVCIEDLKSDSKSLRSAKKHIAAERFRYKAGFVNTV